MNISKFHPSENEILASLFPKDWHFDFVNFAKQHYGREYFKGYTLYDSSKAIGFACLFIFKTKTWLGNIVVDKQYRGKGLGTQITQKLIELGWEAGCKTQNLIATELGRPVYEKLGFIAELNYDFYTSEKNNFNFNLHENIAKANITDLKAILELDYSITLEDRSNLLGYYLDNTYLIYGSNKKLKAYFIDAFESGFIASSTSAYGVELLKLKLNLGSTKVIVPETNSVIKNFLAENGFKKSLSLPKMTLGEKYHWRSELVFNRGAGYCG